jgi:hypothetical protein
MELPVDEIDIALFTAATRVTVHDGKKASFWFSSWIDGRSPASLFPALCRHNRTVRYGELNGKWISDIAHNLNNDILKYFFELWQLGLGEFRGILCKLCLYNPIQWPN